MQHYGLNEEKNIKTENKEEASNKAREWKKKENQIHSHIIITNIKRINIFIQIHAEQSWMKRVVWCSGVCVAVVGFYLIYTKI